MIRWTPQEKRQLIAEYHALKQKGEPGSQKTLLSKAQKVLAPERQTIINSPRACEFNKAYKQAVLRKDVEPPVTEESTEIPFTIIPLEKTVVVEKHPDYGKIPTVTLCRVLLERLATLEETEARMLDFTKALEGKRKQEHTYDRALDPRPPEAKPEEKALRICIVGMLKSQQSEIESRITSITRPLKIKWLDAQHEGEEFGDAVQHIILTKFITHKWWDKAKATHLGNDRIHFVDGGIQAVAQKIFDIASRQTVTASNGHTIPKALIPTT